MVGDLEKLSRAIATGTPEKVAERELRKKTPQIQEALRRNGFYEASELGVRISATVPAR